MFKNVVVGVDGGEGGRDAIALAKWLRNPDGKLTLGHVYAGEPHVWRGANAAYDEVQRERAQELLNRAREEAEVEAQVPWYAASTVGRGLHELAEHAHADLLVIGSSRRGLLGRVLIGDDTRSALNGAPCAVAIAPAGYGERAAALEKIGVGYDGSPESENSVRVARVLAEARGATVSALQVVSVPARLYAAPAYPSKSEIEEMLELAAAGMSNLQGVKSRVAYGEPAEELALFSGSLDLLVLGSRSYGPVGRFIHGSTARRLARTARCPLLVLTRAAREADAVATAQESQMGAAANLAV